MKSIITVLLLFVSICSFSQVEYLAIDGEGKTIECVLLTKENYEKLFELLDGQLEGVHTIEDEISFLVANATDARYIALRYNKSNDNKNGFSTTEIYLHCGGVGNPSERVMSELIFEKILGLRE